MMSWLFLYPIDVVKSRFQADDRGRYKNIYDCILKSYREEGARVFAQGMTSTMLRAFPTNAVTFFTVEWVYRLANGYLLKNVRNGASDNDKGAIDDGREFSTKESSWLFFSLPEHQSQSTHPTTAVLETLAENYYF